METGAGGFAFRVKVGFAVFDVGVGTENLKAVDGVFDQRFCVGDFFFGFFNAGDDVVHFVCWFCGCIY